MKTRIARTALATALALCLGVGVAGAETLAYRLKWLFNTSVAGDLYADADGHFQDAGLTVAVKAGGPERDAIRELELGHADFGVASADQVIRALSKGAPVVVLAQLFQINPLQWIYRAAKPPVNTLADLRGRVLGITYGGNDETIMRTLLAKGGVSEDHVTLFSVRYDYTPFYRDRVDLWPVYRNAQGPILAKKLGESGESVAFFNPADHGVRFVANSVVASRKTVESRPEIVAAFTKALLAGWRAAMDPANAEAVLKMLARFDRDTPEDIRKIQLDLTRNMVRPTPDTVIGAIDAPAWQQTETILLNQKLIPEPVNVTAALLPLP